MAVASPPQSQPKSPVSALPPASGTLPKQGGQLHTPKMGGKVPSTQARSLRTVEILPAVAEDISNGNAILPAVPTPTMAIEPVTPVSPQRSPVLSLSIPAFLTMHGLGEATREDIVDRLVLMLHESQKREKALIYQLQVVENRYAVATSDLAKAKQEAAKNEEDLTARVVAAESFLLKKEKELRNHRKHATQTAPDHSTLAASLDEINKSIEGLALRICTSLDWHDARALLDREALRKLEWRNKPAHALLQHFVACGVSSAATLGEVAKPIARSLFCAVLSDVVFIPFAPGCSSESHEHVAKLYAYVSSREPQESSGRWRASTYNSLRPPESSDHDLVDFIVKSFFRALHDVFTSTARRSHVLHSRTVFVDFRAEATRIAMQALRWRDAVATSCYGHDYTAFYVWPLVRLDAKDFELDSPPPKMSSHTASARSSTAVEVVVLTTSLGLCASTNVPRMGGAFHRNGATLKAAKGFAADFAKLSQLSTEQAAWAVGTASYRTHKWSTWS